MIAITGGGLSGESGFIPFGAAAMPEGVRLEDVVTTDGFKRDPTAVNSFYNLRRREMLAAAPNAAHEALAFLGTMRQRELLIVTRNIDDFHERAGSRTVIHTHGELLKARCLICTSVSNRYDDITTDSACPLCGNAGHLRPHVVWVGEEPLAMAKVYEALAHCTLVMIIGIPPQTEPTRGFVADARRAGARTVEFNRDLGPNADIFDQRFDGPIAAALPLFVKRMMGLA